MGGGAAVVGVIEILYNVCDCQMFDLIYRDRHDN
jgi:hypothetical protein